MIWFVVFALTNTDAIPPAAPEFVGVSAQCPLAVIPVTVTLSVVAADVVNEVVITCAIGKNVLLS